MYRTCHLQVSSVPHSWSLILFSAAGWAASLSVYWSLLQVKQHEQQKEQKHFWSSNWAKWCQALRLCFFLIKTYVIQKSKANHFHPQCWQLHIFYREILAQAENSNRKLLYFSHPGYPHASTIHLSGNFSGLVERNILNSDASSQSDLLSSCKRSGCKRRGCLTVFHFLSHMVPVNATAHRELSISYTVMLRTGTALHFVSSGNSILGAAHVGYRARNQNSCCISAYHRDDKWSLYC